MCTVTHTFAGSVDAGITAASAKIIAEGGTFTRNDATSGSFSVPVSVLGHIVGTYTISGHDITIEITSRPFIISCGQIQTYVDNNL